MAQVELPIIQLMYDLIKWYVPRLNKFPRDHRFGIADRIHDVLFGILETLIRARYRKEKLSLLENLNAELDVLRYQTRLCRDFSLIDIRRYEHVSGLINQIGEHLGGWIRQQRARQ